MKSTTFSSAVNTYNSLIISLKHFLFQQVRKEYQDIRKIPPDRRTTEAYTRKATTLVASLNQLLDISKKSLQQSNLITAEDRDFLVNHWDKTISTVKDMGTSRMIQKKLDVAEKYQVYAEKQRPLQNTSGALDLSIDLSSQDEANSSLEFTPSLPKKKKRTGTSLYLGVDILSKIGPAADRLNLTSNQVIGTTAALVNNSGGDVDDITLSKSSAIRRQEADKEKASKVIKENFSCNNGCQINFDGKLLKDLPGHLIGKVNRLAVTLFQESGTDLLSIAKTEDSTGEGEARAIHEILEQWEVTDNVIAMCFDMTSANTGINKGACKILQKKLKRQLIWMACRHHVLELVIGAAFKELFGATSGPEVPLFKKFQEIWPTLDLSNLILPDIPSYLEPEKKNLSTFINQRLEGEKLPRSDYKELLELSKVMYKLPNNFDCNFGFIVHVLVCTSVLFYTQR